MVQTTAIKEFLQSQLYSNQLELIGLNDQEMYEIDLFINHNYL